MKKTVVISLLFLFSLFAQSAFSSSALIAEYQKLTDLVASSSGSSEFRKTMEFQRKVVLRQVSIAHKAKTCVHLRDLVKRDLTPGVYFLFPTGNEAVQNHCAANPNQKDGQISLKKGKIIGYIDSVTAGFDKTTIKGWACETYQYRSITLHMYLGGAAGKGGTYFGSGVANKSSEEAVNGHCKTGLYAHRFEASIPNAELAAHRGKTIHIHGLTEDNPHGNLELTRSGQFRVPTPQSGQIKGWLDTLEIRGDNVFMGGWACEQGRKESIKVHVYVGGPAGKGKMLGEYTANKASEGAVATECGTGLNSHRFQIYIPNSKMVYHRGKPIYVHGITMNNPSGNLVLKGSGKTIPSELGRIKGDIWHIRLVDGGYTEFYGWACENFRKESIYVDAYVGGPAGKGTKIGRSLANVGTGSWVQEHCHSGKNAHTFRVKVPNSQLAKYQGMPVYIHGLTKDRPQDNAAIADSGKYTIPRTSSGQVIGWVDSVKVSGDKVVVSGWACEKGLKESIPIHLYVGGAAGKGKFIGSYMANLSSEAAVAQECGTGMYAHRYKLYFDRKAASAYSGQRVYIHGISKSDNDPNPYLRGSGIYPVP